METALMRATVEDVTLTQGLPRHDAGTMAELLALVATMVDEVAPFRQLDAELHSSDLAPGLDPRTRQLADQLQQQAQRYTTIHRVGGDRKVAHDDHVVILEAVRRGDVVRHRDAAQPGPHPRCRTPARRGHQLHGHVA